MLTKELLQKIIDGSFEFVEGKLPNRPFVKAILEEVRHVLDSQGIDALLAFLASKGVR